MPILTCSVPPRHLKFHGHDHQYQSLVPFFNSNHFPVIDSQHPSLAYQKAYINKPCKFNAKHTTLLAIKASDNSRSETPAPATKPSSAWKKWLVGIMLSMILPSFRNKWAPLLVLKSKVDMTVETVEALSEAVEELAEGVEKLADEVANKLGDDSKLKETVELVERQAKEAVKEAKLAEELVHKVEEVEKKLESEFLERNRDQTKMDKDNPKRC